MDPRVAFAIGVGSALLLTMLIVSYMTHKLVEGLTDHGKEESKEEKREGSCKGTETDEG